MKILLNNKDNQWNQIIDNLLDNYKNEPKDEFLEWAKSIKVEEQELSNENIS